MNFWETPYILGTVEARNFKCGMDIDSKELYNNMQNQVKGVVTGSRNLLTELWDPLYILGAVEARNSKFGIQIDDTEHCKNLNIIRTLV